VGPGGADTAAICAGLSPVRSSEADDKMIAPLLRIEVLL
jgi:hypothetical protein